MHPIEDNKALVISAIDTYDAKWAAKGAPSVMHSYMI
jgi:hypothetical protein